MQQTKAQWEASFNREIELERERRTELRRQAVARSRARRIQRKEQRGTVAFGVLVGALTLTAVVVVLLMFETLAWLMA